MQTYIIGFLFMECGPIACGLGFNGYDKDGNPKFDRVQNVILWNMEFTSTVKDFFASWNMTTQKWLKYYIFIRMLPNDRNKSGGKNSLVLASAVTFATSAVWHGFYPGVHMFFMMIFILDYQFKLAGSVLGPLIEGVVPKPLIFAVSWFWSYSFPAYFGMSFTLLSFEHSHKVFSAMNYCGHVVLICSIIILHAIGVQKKPKVDEKKKVN